MALEGPSVSGCYQAAHLLLCCCEGLIDFGQSKQLTEEERLAFARLVIAMSKAEGAELLEVVMALDASQQQAVSQGLQDIGIRSGLLFLLSASSSSSYNAERAMGPQNIWLWPRPFRLQNSWRLILCQFQGLRRVAGTKLWCLLSCRYHCLPSTCSQLCMQAGRGGARAPRAHGVRHVRHAGQVLIPAAVKALEY